MKNKIIILLSCVIIALGLFSFKSNSNDSTSNKAAIVGKFAEGFRITYGDGTIDTRLYNVDKTKLREVVIQLQVTAIINELKEKGFHSLAIVRSQKAIWFLKKINLILKQ